MRQPALFFVSFVLLLFLLPALAASAGAGLHEPLPPPARTVPAASTADRAVAAVAQPYLCDLVFRYAAGDDGAAGLAL